MLPGTSGACLRLGRAEQRAVLSNEGKVHLIIILPKGHGSSFLPGRLRGQSSKSYPRQWRVASLFGSFARLRSVAFEFDSAAAGSFVNSHLSHARRCAVLRLSRWGAWVSDFPVDQIKLLQSQILGTSDLVLEIRWTACLRCLTGNKTFVICRFPHYGSLIVYAPAYILSAAPYVLVSFRGLRWPPPKA